MKARRIMALCGGTQQPLFDTTPLTDPSPSLSLLVETHQPVEDTRHERTIQDQVVTLFLGDAIVEHTSDDIASQRIVVPSGAVVLSLRHQQEEIGWVKPAKVMCATIDDDVYNEAAHALGWENAPRLVPNNGARDEQLSSLLRALYLEQTSGYPGGALFIDSIERALAAHLVHTHAGDRRSVLSRRDGLSPAIARRVEAFVHSHMGKDVDLQSMASTAGYSPSRFCLLFRQTFQVTPHRYVQQARIEQAMTMLRTRRSQPILAVALACGFRNQQHFSRVFRAITGTTPGVYRREC